MQETKFFYRRQNIYSPDTFSIYTLSFYSPLIIILHHLTYCAIQSVNWLVRANTLYPWDVLHSPEPHETDPWRVQTPSFPRQTKGPPLSPWQPLSTWPGPNPAHTILSVTGMPMFTVFRLLHSSLLTTRSLDCFCLIDGGPDCPTVYWPQPERKD